ncbi:MAG: hypothetical protein JWO82_3585 [Akkermansiaceae bacterium]|nr:hypothetical protein [Akkermansiaceae bacterium]
MSADPSSSAGLPGRSRPVLSDLSKETTEEDLWNLDEDGLSSTPLPPAREAGEPQDGNAETPAEEGVQKAPAVVVRPIKTPAPKAIVIEPAAEKISPKVAKAAKPEPQRAKPVDTFDDLDEDTFEEDDVPEGAAARKGPDLSQLGSEARKTPAAEPEPDEGPVTYVSLSDDDDALLSAPEESASGRRGLKISSRELIGLGIFAFVLLLAGIWAVTSFYGLINIKKDPRTPPHLPVNGKYASVTKQTTFWRTPVTQGAERDRPQRDVILLPVLELTLGSANSGSGALRVIFRDETGRSLGDAVTRAFSGGKFEGANSEVASFPSTAGFEQMGTFNSYVSGPGDPWSARVLEGPSANAPADQFVPLVDIPVSGFRH